MRGLSHSNLSNILKSYALINPNLNYCQGMNFMAGFLFLQTGDIGFISDVREKKELSKQESLELIESETSAEAIAY
jgi:hypothetical protein